MNKYINVAIAGATGYLGIELIKLLTKHPKVKIKKICARKFIGKPIYKFDPLLKKKSLPKNSNLTTISSAYKKLTLKYRPDKNPDKNLDKIYKVRIGRYYKTVIIL